MGLNGGQQPLFHRRLRWRHLHAGTRKLPGHRGKGFYAAQTFSHDPKGRTVQIGWFQTATPGMPFNQSMTVPLELSLKTTAEGPRLAWRPVEELSRTAKRKT